MSELVVELSGERIGRLVGDWRSFDFRSEAAAVQRHGLGSTVLSVSVPLEAIAARGRKGRRQSFFQELLPEGRMLDRLAREAGVPTHDTIGLLRAHGRDIAGALQIWDATDPGEPRLPRTEPLDDGAVARMLELVQEHPLGNRGPGGKTSLAGVQDKIVLARSAAGWSRVLDGAPSTHIVKPVAAAQPSLIYDEAYGQAIARSIGISDFATAIVEFGHMPALVIERYDRSSHTPDGRIHQEDCNQALGARGDEKYQRRRGKVSLARIAALLRAHAGAESLHRLARMTVAAAAVGNLDMHAKNLSLLHAPDGEISLAPAYDFVPLAHQSTDGELALSVDGEYRHETITAAHLVAEIASWRVRDAEPVVLDTADAVLEAAATIEPHARAHVGLQSDVARFSRNLRDGRAISAL